jgi:hypothetical protein
MERRGMHYVILVGNLEGKRLLGKSIYTWQYDIKMNLGETGWGGMDWIGLA